MGTVKSLAAIRDKWQRVTPQRAEDFRIGVQNPRRSWEQESAAASDRYKAGVDLAHTKGQFAKGIKAAGNAKWQTNALSKGPSRFAEGVALSGDFFEKGFAPYREVIEQTQLPPKFPKGDPRNNQRSIILSQAMHKRRTG